MDTGENHGKTRDNPTHKSKETEGKPRKPNKRENKKETNYSKSQKPKDNPEGC